MNPHQKFSQHQKSHSHANYNYRTKGQKYNRAGCNTEGFNKQNSHKNEVIYNNAQEGSSASTYHASTSRSQQKLRKDSDQSDREPNDYRNTKVDTNRKYQKSENSTQIATKPMPEESEKKLSIGTVVNGRYVRKNSINSQTSTDRKLNVDAQPFVPKASATYKRTESYVSQGAKPKFAANTNREFYNNNRRPKANQGYHHQYESYYNQDYQNRPRFKNAQNSNKRKSLDKNITIKNFNIEVSESEDENNVVLEINKKLQNAQALKAVSTPKESVTQRERLVLQLERSECECLVCCEPVRIRDYIWSCRNCYHVFHLRCIKKWARSPNAVVNDAGWRCPACQNVTEDFPSTYYCFCGKQKDPEVNPHYIPHSCGEVCGRQREEKHCIHGCNILCHPGPCPPCSAVINKACECGKTQKTVPCAKSESIICSGQCDKLLNCGVHRCSLLCHVGECDPCAVTLKQRCHCDSEEKEVLCGPHTSKGSGYSCGSQCGKYLSCDNHFCLQICHPGACDSCKLLPALVTSCPCGKTLLEDMHSSPKRLSCADAIPVCGQQCGKTLPCGPKGNPHKCSSVCHIGDCEPCSLTTMVKCRCGLTSKETPCKEMLSTSFSFECKKRCNRRKVCGRHKCLNLCCNSSLHRCELVCNKKLSCGLHHCQETCHAGNCHTCWNVSFDELTCHCGFSIQYPPIACGKKPPECSKPCIRIHPCDHQVQHSCHNEDKCPPCTVLTVKWCFGHHEKRPSVQCFVDGISCGKPCDKPLPCDRHKCLKTCHGDSCLKPGAKCTQPCTTLRSCGHPCAAPCHDGQCPDTICKAKIDVSCPCGHRNEITTCSEVSGAFHMMSVGMLASKIRDIKAGESVNISEIFSKKGKSNKLQCNEECAVIERNKRLAVALQIQNPELSCKPGPPNYSKFLKDETRKNLRFVSGVYDKFCELVQLAKQSKQKSRSYSFPAMNRDHRRVVHELAEFFGCDSQSYDEEPVKNVVITAFRERSWLPFVSVITIVERDMGIRRCPPPVTHVPVKPPAPTPVISVEKKEKSIDYFEFTGL